MVIHEDCFHRLIKIKMSDKKYNITNDPIISILIRQRLIKSSDHY
jgi:hypothetical protein